MTDIDEAANELGIREIATVEVDLSKKPSFNLAHLFGDQPNPGDYDNGVWEHMCSIPRVPLQKKLSDNEIGLWLRSNDIDVLICTMWDTYIGDCAGTKPLGGIEAIKEVVPDIKIIGLVDHPMTVDVTTKFGADHMNMKLIKSYVDALSEFDALMVLTEKEVPFYQAFNVNTHFVGLPFPSEGMGKFTSHSLRPEKQSDDIWVGLSVGGPAGVRWDRNYLCTLEAFKLAKEIVSERYEEPELASKMKGVMLSFTEQDDRDISRFFKENYEDVFIQMRTDMKTYLEFLQSCDCVISNIVRDTPGRLVGECAHFGIPLVGSHTLDMQERCYPDLAVDPYDICSTAGKLAEIIAGKVDSETIGLIKSKAKRELAEFEYEASLLKFRKVLDSIGMEGREWTTADSEDEEMFI